MPTSSALLGLDQPPVLPQHVARVTADGRPTRYLLDWEQFTYQFQASALQSLDTRIETVESTSGDAFASGEIYFAAKATPAGATAAYGLFLTAGDAFAGFEVLALSVGGSAINMTADKLMFSDSGTATAVFDYGVSTPGVFTFNVPVEIRNSDIGVAQVSNSVVATGSVGAGSDLTTAALTVRAGARVDVLVTVSETSATIYLASFSASFISRGFTVSYNSTPIGSMYSMDTIVASNFLGGSSYAFYKAVTPSAEVFTVSGLPAGSYTFSVNNGAPAAVTMSIKATETK